MTFANYELYLSEKAGTQLGFGRNIGVGFGSIGVGFGSIGVGFGFRAGGGGNIDVGLDVAGCPAAGDTGEAEGVSELWEAAVAKEALAGCCLLLSWSFWSQKRQPSPKNRIQKTICLITGGHKSQQSGQNRAGDADGSGAKTKAITKRLTTETLKSEAGELRSRLNFLTLHEVEPQSYPLSVNG
jgi:hypothetical protein